MKHWQKYPTEIKAMVAARKFAGIHNESSFSNFRTAQRYYAIISKTGNENRLLAVMGNVADIEETVAEQQWVKVLEGYHYAYYFPATMNTAYVDLASGIYDGQQKARLTAVTAEAGAQLVYTTDGSNPTAASTKAASGETITIAAGTTTLKVALLIGSTVSGMVTRTYTVREAQSDETVIPDFCTVADGEVCAFFEAPKTWVQTIMCWAWDNKAGNVNYTGGNWPGVECTKLGTAPNGKAIWKWTMKAGDFKGAAADIKQPSHIIFSSNGSPQTADLTFTNCGFYTEDGLFGVVEASQGVEGDVNGDGTVDVADISAVITTMANDIDRPEADVNGDGSVDVADISRVITIMAGN